MSRELSICLILLEIFQVFYLKENQINLWEKIEVPVS